MKYNPWQANMEQKRWLSFRKNLCFHRKKKSGIPKCPSEGQKKLQTFQHLPWPNGFSVFFFWWRLIFCVTIYILKKYGPQIGSLTPSICEKILETMTYDLHVPNAVGTKIIEAKVASFLWELNRIRFHVRGGNVWEGWGTNLSRWKWYFI